MPKSQGPAVLQLRITLQGVEPAIWRRLLVPSGISLAQLSEIFQAAMGWSGSHLHAFTVGEQHYVMQDDEDDDFDDELDEEEFSVRAATGDERRFRYRYDFGDDWQHQVEVEEEVITAPLEFTFAVCLDGQRSCPPEDCGGPSRYAHPLQAIADPGHEEHDARMELVGDDFDPEEFDLAVTNVVLQYLG